MAITSISDLEQHVPFLLNYINQQSVARSAFVQSGICATDPQIAQLVAQSGARGTTVALPFWNDLAGEDEVITEGTRLTPAKITAGQDVAHIHRRGKPFSASDLAADISGNDPIRAIGDRLTAYRIRQRQRVLFSTLKGVFADNLANDEGDLILDISEQTGDAALLGKFSLLDAAQLLGDAKEKLVAVACHSAAELALTKVAYETASQIPGSDVPGALPRYSRFNVVVDDSCAYDPSTGVAEFILFGAGAIALQPAKGTAKELATYRDELDSVSGIVERDFYIMHPRGIKWVGTPTNADKGASASNSDLESASSWDRVYEKKNIRLAKLVCKLG